MHAYETQGVHATAEVQAAARKVADENRSLRAEVNVLREKCKDLERILELANDRGIEGREVDGGEESVKKRARKRKASAEGCSGRRRLDGSTAAARGLQYHEDPTNLRREDMSSLSSFTARIVTEPLQDAELLSIPTSYSLAEGVENNPPLPTKATRRANNDLNANQSPQKSTFVTSPTISDYPTPISSFAIPISAAPSPTTARCSSTPIPNSTPCLQAALIIASMRGVPSTDEDTLESEILPELGCVGPLGQPSCLPTSGVGEAGCVSHAGPGFRRPGRIGSRVILAETADCAVDNGRLFGILARDD